MAPTPPARTPGLARALAVVAGAALLLYAPTLRHGFVFDDDVVIVKNRLIRSVATLPALVSRTEWSGGGHEFALWRPLTGLTYAVNHAVSGLSPWSYHLGNALLHALCAALVLALGLELGLGLAAAAGGALLFALHPVHVEAVANVVGRKDVLATALVLVMALLHRRARRTGRAGDLALAALAYAGAMLSKEVGVVGIALVALTDALKHAPSPRPSPPAVPGEREVRGDLSSSPRDGNLGASSPSPRETGRGAFASYAVYAALLAIYLVLLRTVTAAASAAPIAFEDNPAAAAPGLVRVLTALAVIGKGLALQLLPLSQSPDYSFAAIPLVGSPLDPRLLGTVALLVAWGGAGVALRRRAPVVLWSLAWYLAAILPASNLLFPVGTLFGERLLYLPSVALALLAGAAGAAVAARAPRPAALAAGAAILVACAVAAARYSEAWADEETLFRHAVRAQPASAKVHHKLALVLVDRAPEEALASIRRSLAILEAEPQAHLVHAELLHRLGRATEQEAALRRGLELAPGNADGLYAMGRLARDGGRVDEAAGWWRRAVAARVDHAPALADLAAYHLLRGDAAASLAFATRAVESDPDQASAWYTLALLHQARRDRAQARRAYERFVATAGPEYAPEVAQVRALLARGGP